LSLGEPNSDQVQQLRGIFFQLCAQPASVLESETLEIKNWCSDDKQLGEKAAESSVCLANQKGGIVLLGIEDRGNGTRKFSRCRHSNVTAEWIAQRIQDGTVPPVEIAVVDASKLLQEVSSDSSVNCFAVFVTKSRHVGGHQTSGGVSKIRRGKDCRPYYSLTADDRTKAPIAFADEGCLSKPSIHWGIEQHKRKFGMASDQWESESGFLAHIGLIEAAGGNGHCVEDRISLAGLLLFGTESAIRHHCPGIETVVITPAGEERFHLNIVECFRQLCGSRNSILQAHCPHIPEACVKEVLINCYVHRDYRMNSPIVLRVNQDELEFTNPGALCTGLSADSLLYCTPVYRNFLLAEGARYLGLCDKVGRGIDAIYDGLLHKGLGFPIFENGESDFTTRISLNGSREFSEFLKRRSQSLGQLDEVIVLRYLFDREHASFRELCSAMQRSSEFGHKVLTVMKDKSMIEPSSALNLEWRLCSVIRSDIEHIFRDDQYRLEFEGLFGEQPLD
jgi:ATP-dependent DNA helicase RecG